MQVLLLAAGRSQRIQPVPDKNFLKFLGKTLIEHQVANLQKAGFKNITIVGGKHNLDRFKELFPKLTVVEQKALKEGMAGAVLAMGTKLKNEPLLIVSSNDIVEQSAYNAIKKSATKKVDSLIIGKTVKEYFPGGYLKTDSKGLITGIVEKPGAGKEPSNLINLVIHLHKNPKELIKYLTKTKSTRDDRYEVALDKMIKDGKKMLAVPYKGYWQSIKFPWHVFEVKDYFFSKLKRKIAKSANIAKQAVINGPVVIEAGVKVFPGAVVNGPAYIGKNSIVANNALVRDSIVGDNCVVGYSTEVARSYVGDDSWFHTNYIGDSIISDNCSFGSGTVTGNLRLDEANIPVNIKDKKTDSGINKFGLVCGPNVRAGINCSFMPGIKVGANSMIGAGIVIPQDIPENSFVRGKWDLKISKNKASLDNDARAKMRKKLK